MDISRQMLRQNPWWRDTGSINADKKILAWKDSLRYEPRIMYKMEYDFDYDRSVVYTLRGPRQVGKTTLVKLQIKKFLNEGVDPRNILYCAMDLARGPQDVVDAIDRYMQITRRATAGRRYLFLDEISSVPDWQIGIKWSVDAGLLRNCTVLATGSHSIDLKRATERLPGRTGDVNGANDKVMLPMKFSEYASILNPDIRGIIKEHLLSFNDRREALLGLAEGRIDERLDRLMPYLDVLNGLLEDYMITGGLPRVVSRYVNSRTIKDPDYGRYVRVLAGEWTRIHKDMARLNALGQRLVTSLGTPVSWTGLAKKSSLGSHRTARDYADTLESLFTACVVYKYDMNHRRPLYNKCTKIYFVDPFFLHMFRTMTGPDDITSSMEYLELPENRGGMLEGIVANHLMRLALLLTKKKSAFDPHQHVFYWRGSKAREVDFVLDVGRQARIPVEVKSGNNVNASKLRGLARFTGSTGTAGVVLAKSILKEERYYSVVPAAAFLALV